MRQWHFVHTESLDLICPPECRGGCGQGGGLMRRAATPFSVQLVANTSTEATLEKRNILEISSSNFVCNFFTLSHNEGDIMLGNNNGHSPVIFDDQKVNFYSILDF